MQLREVGPSIWPCFQTEIRHYLCFFMVGNSCPVFDELGVKHVRRIETASPGVNFPNQQSKDPHRLSTRPSLPPDPLA